MTEPLFFLRQGEPVLATEEDLGRLGYISSAVAAKTADLAIGFVKDLADADTKAGKSAVLEFGDLLADFARAVDPIIKAAPDYLHAGVLKDSSTECIYASLGVLRRLSKLREHPTVRQVLAISDRACGEDVPLLPEELFAKAMGLIRELALDDEHLDTCQTVTHHQGECDCLVRNAKKLIEEHERAGT